MSRKSQLQKSRKNSPVSEERLIQVVQQQLEHYSGPVPKASELEKYEAICPGYAKELLNMAKLAQEHSRKMDESEFEMQSKFSSRHQDLFARGQIIGGIIAIIGVGCGTAVALSGSANAGAAIIGAVFAVLGGAFAWSKWCEKKV